jgi:hypothetical protein
LPEIIFPHLFRYQLFTCRLWMDTSDVTKTNTIRPARAHAFLSVHAASGWIPVMLRKQTPSALPERTTHLFICPGYLYLNDLVHASSWGR